MLKGGKVNVKTLWSCFGNDNILSILAKNGSERVLNDIIMSLKTSNELCLPVNQIRLRQALNLKNMIE